MRKELTDRITVPKAMFGARSFMSIEDEIRKPRGMVRKLYRDNGGEWNEIPERSNLLVFYSRTAIVHLLGEADDDWRVSEFGMGTRGHSGNILDPVPPMLSDTGLYSEGLPPPDYTFYKTIYKDPAINGTYFEYTGNGSEETAIRYIIPIEASEANGDGVNPVPYTEWVLRSVNGRTLARHTDSAMIKKLGREFVFEWILIS